MLRVSSLYGLNRVISVARRGFLASNRHIQPTLARFSSTSPLHGSTNTEPETPQVDSIPFTFESSFHVQNNSTNIYSVQEGGYVDLDPKDLTKYFPEGLAGEMDKEFEFSGRQSWMIRDSAKILCRIIDQFGASTINSKAPGSSSSGNGGDAKNVSIHKAVNLPELTDRPEWTGSTLRVQYFGQDLLPAPQETIATSSKFKRTAMSTLLPEATTHSIVNGKGSVVDKCLSKLQDVSGTSAMPPKIMLVGPRGVGKSAALNQAIMHARKSGWLCLFVPKGWDQVQSGWYIEPVAPLRPADKGVYDNVFMSAEVLRGFWKAHAGQLRRMPMKYPKETDKYTSALSKFKEAYDRARSVSGREKLSFRQMREIVDAEDFFAEQDTLDASVLDGPHFEYPKIKLETLEDLVLLGVAFRELAGSVVMDLVAELKEVESIPVLIAVDQYNTWEAQSAYSYKSEPVSGRQLCVPHSLSFIGKKKADTDKWRLKNGLCICSTSHAHAEGRNETFENYKSSVPLVIKVPNYSQVEFLSAATYYTHQNLIAKGTSTQELLTFRMISGSNPFSTRKEAVPFFFPISVGRLGDDPMTKSNADLEGLDEEVSLSHARDDEDSDSAAAIADEYIESGKRNDRK